MGRRYKVELSLTRSELITLESMFRFEEHAFNDIAESFNEVAKEGGYPGIIPLKKERAKRLADYCNVVEARGAK